MCVCLWPCHCPYPFIIITSEIVVRSWIINSVRGPASLESYGNFLENYIYIHKYCVWVCVCVYVALLLLEVIVLHTPSAALYTNSVYFTVYTFTAVSHLFSFTLYKWDGFHSPEMFFKDERRYSILFVSLFSIQRSSSYPVLSCPHTHKINNNSCGILFLLHDLSLANTDCRPSVRPS